jgi:two-component SAPR family response regulator
MVIPNLCWVKFWILTLFLFFLGETYSQSNEISGIKFNSKNVPRNQRTSIFLNDGQPIKLSTSFSISFDISFWDYRKFGPILRIEDEQGNEIRLVYNQFKNSDTSYIQVVLPSGEDIIELKVTKDTLIRNHWFNLKLIFDRNEKYLKVYCNNTYAGKAKYLFGEQDKYSFVFGLKWLDNPNDYDVPSISIKNILITEQNKHKYFWSLNPLKQIVYEDQINDLKIKVINPRWIYEDHINWRKLTDIKISNHTIAHLGVAFDSLNSRLFVDAKNKLIIYDLISGKDSIINYKSPSPAYWNDLFYEKDKQLLYSYFTGMGNVSVYDLIKNDWVTIDKSTNTDGYYFGSAKFINSKDHNLYLFGGYGWYKTKNDLFKYNFIKQIWEQVELKKNDLTPRAWFSIGKGFNEGEYLIYGGFGNSSGYQERGFNSYYDLFLLNINDSTTTKLDLPASQKFSYGFLFNNLHLDKKDTSLYFLSQIEDGKEKYIVLNKLDLKTGIATQVGNKFWKRDGDKWIYAYLHHSKSTNEFISVIFDSTTVELFSINYPPISGNGLATVEQFDNADKSNFIVFVIAAFGLLVILIIYIKKIKNKSVSNSQLNNHPENFSDLKKITQINNIQLFGGFHIYNNQGKDIIYEFSPKLKEILLLIILRSFNHYKNKGITSEDLSSTIWPDASSESVKSSRGVAINKIRKLLASVDGIDLDFTDKQWLINLNNGARCDYLQYLKLRDSGKISPSVILDNFYGGEFLKGISYEWLDSIKFSINNSTIEFLKQFLNNEEIKDNNDKLIKLCELILVFDSVDQEVIKIKIRTLLSAGKLHLAKSTYKLFIAEYKRLYDENYPTSFEEIITS